MEEKILNAKIILRSLNVKNDDLILLCEINFKHL